MLEKIKSTSEEEGPLLPALLCSLRQNLTSLLLLLLSRFSCVRLCATP